MKGSVTPHQAGGAFRVTAFACVPAQSVGQRDYLLEGEQRCSTQDAPTRAAAGTLTTEGM